MIKLLFEKYIEEFSNNVNIESFILNLIITAILASLLRLFYIRYGNTISNRSKFASIFLPLALTTMLIIMIVKSSIALSLGLVGALSIVRFRAAIKDPEELTYLFLAIGLGLAAGADQPLLSVLAFTFIVGILFLHKKLTGKVKLKQEDKMYVNINTDKEELTEVSNILSDTLPYVELKRMDTLDTGLDLSFICKAESLEQISNITKQLKALSPKTSVSIIDQPDLIV